MSERLGPGPEKDNHFDMDEVCRVYVEFVKAIEANPEDYPSLDVEEVRGVRDRLFQMRERLREEEL